MRSRYFIAAAVAFIIFAHFTYSGFRSWRSSSSTSSRDAPSVHTAPQSVPGTYVSAETTAVAPQGDAPIASSTIASSMQSIQSPEPPPPRCSLTKVSMLYGNHKFSQLESALQSHRRHCDRWGCKFECLEQDISSRKLYSKHYFLLSTMLHELSKPAEERTTWLMWVDADSILVNPSLSPCVFLPPDEMEDVFALVTADHQGLNNGVFYLRVHPSAVDLLTQTAAYPLVHPDEDLGWFGEQEAMARVINATEIQLKNENRTPGIAWVPREWFNAYEWEHGFEGKPGHFMVHFAGLAETRLSHMSDWLMELEKDQAKWALPLEETFYKTDIPQYWERFAATAVD